MLINQDQINPLKLAAIQKGLNFISDMNSVQPVISKVVLFGSSVRSDCKDSSDIDLCFFSKFSTDNPVFFKIYGSLPMVMNDLCDIFIYEKLPSDLKEVINKTGVTIYEYQ